MNPAAGDVARDAGGFADRCSWLQGASDGELVRVCELAFAGKLTPVVDRVLPLEQTAEGETALERRQVFGKVIITPGGAGAP